MSTSNSYVLLTHNHTEPQDFVMSNKTGLKIAALAENNLDRIEDKIRIITKCKLHLKEMPMNPHEVTALNKITNAPM